jgi:hypothetical protein
MFWRALRSELRARLRRPLLAATSIAGLILTAIFIAGATDRNMSPEAIPLRGVLLPLLITLTWSVCGYRWLSLPAAQPESSVCHSCGFSLAGHSQGAEHCPECGVDPATFTWKHTAARRIVLAIGGIMLTWALLCCLAAFCFLSLWGRID